MTRKHFREAADIIKSIVDLGDRKKTAVRFATLFRISNKRFDAIKFFKACEVEYVGN